MPETRKHKKDEVVDTPSSLVIQSAGAVLSVVVVALKIRRAVLARKAA